MILAAFIVGGCLVATPYAWAMLRGRRSRYERVGLLLPLTVAMLAAPVQIVVGDWAARHVAEHQPAKLAAMEGLYATTKGATLHIGGVYIGHEVKGGIPIPDGLSFLAFHNPHAVVQGLASVPASDRAPVNVVRTAFQLMVAIGTAMLGLGLWMLLAWRKRKTVPRSRWFLPRRGARGPRVGGRARVRLGHDRSRAPAVDRLAGHARARRGDRRAEHPFRLLPADPRVRVHGPVRSDRGPPADERAAARSPRRRIGSRVVMTLANACAAVMFVGIAVYALFAGADFGAGLWDFVAGGDERGRAPRALIEESIAPVWEANHVWLIFVLVTMWTAFPSVFARDHVDALRPADVGCDRDHPPRCGVRVPQGVGDAAAAPLVRRDLRVVVVAHALHAGCGGRRGGVGPGAGR